MSELGRLERVELRDIWQTEAQDFTPWLAGEENLSLLGETLGIDLELEAVERSVGVFRADILCKDTVTDRWVLIENQLERTDHNHLGQLITYAAGLDAVTIVWIARQIADEHRAACDWLNEITDASVRFFALEVELWRIGSSPAAPKFNVVSKPNDWTRSASSGKKAIAEGELSPTREMQRDYWTEMQALIASRAGPIKPVSAQPISWLNHGIGKTGVALGFVMNTREKWVRAEIYFGSEWAASDFAQLAAQREEIEREFGAALDWQELPEKRDCRICVYLQSADPFDKDDWPRQHAWLADNGSRLHTVFAPRVARLVRDKTASAGDAE